MRAVLDSNIFIDALRGDAAVLERLGSLGEGEGMYSAITLAEVLAGTKPQQDEPVRVFLSSFLFCEVSETIARQGGSLRREHGKRGLTVEDALIAATALVHGAALVSRDRVFSSIPGLRVERW